MPSFILIHPTVWTIHQRYGQINRQDMTGQDNGPIAYGEPFYKRPPKKTVKRGILSALGISQTRYKALYKCPVYLLSYLLSSTE